MIANNITNSDALDTLKSVHSMFSVSYGILFNCYYSAYSAVNPSTYASIFGGTTVLMNILYGLGFMYTDVTTALATSTSLSNYWLTMGTYLGDIIMRIFYRKSLTSS